MLKKKQPPQSSENSKPDTTDPRVRLLRHVIADEGPIAPEHLEDLRKSSLTDQTICRQRFRTLWPKKIEALLGFGMAGLNSGLLIPFPDPQGGFMDHIRLKVFPQLKDAAGHTIKYLQPKGSGVRLFFPLEILDAALHGNDALWLI